MRLTGHTIAVCCRLDSVGVTALRVCFVCIEIFGVKKFGGFGRATRILGREMARRGHEVHAVVPLPRSAAKSEFTLDGIRVVGVPGWSMSAAMKAFRNCDADIYHSQDTSMGTYLAMRAMPDRAHVITFRDPLDLGDRWTELRYAITGGGSLFSKLGAILYSAYIDNGLVRRAVLNGDALFCAAQFLAPKVAKKYRLKRPPQFLPTPVAIAQQSTKAQRPTVCFVARWDPRKRPELFFDIALKFPDVRFVAVGGSQDAVRDRRLRETYGDIPNLDMPGVINQFESNRLFEILDESWVLVNTAAREALPNVFIEALAHKCAVLSFSDPDGLTSRFGCCVEEGQLEAGLRFLLENDEWRKRGRRGYEYVERVFSLDRTVDRHLEAYDDILKGRRAA